MTTPVDRLLEAAQAVVDNWSHGDLAGAVNDLEYEATELRANLKAPWVVACLDGGIVQDSWTVPGIGDPTFDALDFDREGSDPEDLRSFIDYARPLLTELRDLGFIDVGGYLDDLDRFERWLKEEES